MGGAGRVGGCEGQMDAVGRITERTERVADKSPNNNYRWSLRGSSGQGRLAARMWPMCVCVCEHVCVDLFLDQCNSNTNVHECVF